MKVKNYQSVQSKDTHNSDKTGLSLWHQSLLSSLLAILSSVIQNEERANKSPAFLLEDRCTYTKNPL